MNTKEQQKKIERLGGELQNLDARLLQARAELAEAKERGNQPRTNPADIAAMNEERAALVTALEKARAELAEFETAQKGKEHKDAVKAIAGKQDEIRKIADELTAMLGDMQTKAERAQALQNEVVTILREHGAGMEKTEADRVRSFAPFHHCRHILEMTKGKFSLLGMAKRKPAYLP